MILQSESVLATADKTAIFLSVLCSQHCLLTPVALVMVPSLVGLGLGDEAFHLWMVVAVVPLSLFALTMGCTRHGNKSLLLLGLTGLGVLCSPFVIGHEALGEWGERGLTLLGAAIIALSHFRNFLLCRDCQPSESVS